MDEAIQAAIRERLSTARDVLIVAHVRPDGDAIGSLLGLGLSLQNSGRKRANGGARRRARQFDAPARQSANHHPRYPNLLTPLLPLIQAI